MPVVQGLFWLPVLIGRTLSTPEFHRSCVAISCCGSSPHSATSIVISLSFHMWIFWQVALDPEAIPGWCQCQWGAFSWYGGNSWTARNPKIRLSKASIWVFKWLVLQERPQFFLRHKLSDTKPSRQPVLALQDVLSAPNPLLVVNGKVQHAEDFAGFQLLLTRLKPMKHPNMWFDSRILPKWPYSMKCAHSVAFFETWTSWWNHHHEITTKSQYNKNVVCKNHCKKEPLQQNLGWTCGTWPEAFRGEPEPRSNEAHGGQNGSLVKRSVGITRGATGRPWLRQGLCGSCSSCRKYCGQVGRLDTSPAKPDSAATRRMQASKPCCERYLF